MGEGVAEGQVWRQRVGEQEAHSAWPWYSACPPLSTKVDGWTDRQQQLDSRNFALSRAFTIIFILLASFVFLSMFVGVMIIHTEVRQHL